MPKVTITIEDAPSGQVIIKAEPNCQTIARFMVTGNEISAAQAYALSAMRHLRDAAKEIGPIRVGSRETKRLVV